MTVIELGQESKLQQTDILHISELVTRAIEIKGSVKMTKTIDSKESILASLAKTLELILTSDNSLTKEGKLEVIHLLTKLKANREHMELIKRNITDNSKAFSKLSASSEHMFKKSQSAFGND